MNRSQVNVDQLLEAFSGAAAAGGFEAATLMDTGRDRLPVLHRPGPHDGATVVAISSGIHGDEPAPPLALLDCLQRHALPDANAYFLFPVLNPEGLRLGTRGDAAGTDLNRDYLSPTSRIVRAHCAWMERHMSRVDLSLHLHEDWESEGFYLYELNFGRWPSRSQAVLRAVEAHCPIEQANEIDGHPTAETGIIRPETVPEVEEGLPEAIWMFETYGCLNYTFETPSGKPLGQRIRALSAAIGAAVGGSWP